MEASVRVECEPDEPFAQEVKAHLDACFDASVPFKPADLDFYQSLQATLHPNLSSPESEELEDFIQVPSAPAVVIHAEDNRTEDSPDLRLYIPKGKEPPDPWFSADRRTKVYLYLYPVNTLLDQTPPSADPVLYEGEVKNFSNDNSISGDAATCQIKNLSWPILETLTPAVIPPAEKGVQAQVVVSLTRRGEGSFPVYVVDKTRPGVRIEVKFKEQVQGREQQVVEVKPLPWEILRYYEGAPFKRGHFVFEVPYPSRTTTITVPGEVFYRLHPERTLSESLQAKEIIPVVKFTKTRLSTAYVYQVHFVFKPPSGTQGV
jgi:hypothetical protein